MPENIGTQAAPYNTRIPRIDENADIQTALRLYHYGDNVNNPDPIIGNSIAGHLDALEKAKISKSPAIIINNQNLNNILESGYYFQPSNANARTGSNYPEYPDSSGSPSFFSGYLNVITDGSLVFQQYHMVGEQGYPINALFWRYRLSGSWSQWRRAFMDDADVLEITDQKYFRMEQVFTRTESNNRFGPRLFLENLQTSNYTLALDDINKVLSMNVSGVGQVIIPTHESAPFPIGSIVNVYNRSSSLLNIVGASGVTVRNLGSLEQYKEASLRKRGNNEWVAAGPLY